MNAFLAHGYCINRGSRNHFHHRAPCLLQDAQRRVGASVRIRRSVAWPAVMMSTVILALSLVTSPASAIPIPDVDGNGHLRLDSSGKCLLSQGSAEDAVAVQYSCLDFADPKWYFIDLNLHGPYNIYNANTNKCLTALLRQL
jgi:hypothetical protein